MSIRGLFTSSPRQRIGSIIFAITLAALSLPKAWAADNPYNLIDAKTISVGTMGDAKPYAFTTADGKFTGFDLEFFLNVVGRMGFKADQVTFTGGNGSGLCLFDQICDLIRFRVFAKRTGYTHTEIDGLVFSDGAHRPALQGP